MELAMHERVMFVALLVALVLANVGFVGYVLRWRRGQKQHLVLVRTGGRPKLTLASGIRYHLFLSHTWASGQDQVAVIKQRLCAMLPGVAIFLDVHLHGEPNHGYTLGHGAPQTPCSV
jgi:hypothetical protein